MFENTPLDLVLDDLQTRFIINIPAEELASIERICFQIEQAHWFYEDFVREENSRLIAINSKDSHHFRYGNLRDYSSSTVLCCIPGRITMKKPLKILCNTKSECLFAAL